MQGGWGAMGAGAWGSSPPVQEEPESPTAAPAAAQPTYGTTGSFKPNPLQASYTPPAPVTSSNGSTSAKEAELRKREAEVAARERQIAQREKELADAGITIKKKNWPICLPVWHHDIGGEIPEKSRRVVREAYAVWWGLLVMLTYQFFCASVMLGYGVGQKVPSWFLSIIFWICGVPLSMWLWYKRIYHAARDDSAMGYVAFFVFFFCHFAWCCFCAVGVQINAARWCFSGFLTAIDAIDRATFPGIIYFAGGAGWSALAAFSLWVLKDAWFFFRGQGGVREVQQRAAQEAALAAFQSKQGSSRV